MYDTYKMEILKSITKEEKEKAEELGLTLEEYLLLRIYLHLSDER